MCRLSPYPLLLSNSSFVQLNRYRLCNYRHIIPLFLYIAPSFANYLLLKIWFTGIPENIYGKDGKLAIFCWHFMFEQFTMLHYATHPPIRYSFVHGFYSELLARVKISNCVHICFSGFSLHFVLLNWIKLFINLILSFW